MSCCALKGPSWTTFSLPFLLALLSPSYPKSLGSSKVGMLSLLLACTHAVILCPQGITSELTHYHGLYSPWNSLGQNTGVGSLSLLQRIFPTQGLNPGLPHCKWILYQLSHKGSPWMWELDYKESWAPKNWCFWTVVLEKTLQSPLDYKEIQPVHPKGNKSWVFIGRTDAEAEILILWPPDGKNWLTGKDSDVGKDWRQEEKGTTEDEMVGWRHWLNGHEFE